MRTPWLAPLVVLFAACAGDTNTSTNSDAADSWAPYASAVDVAHGGPLDDARAPGPDAPDAHETIGAPDVATPDATAPLDVAADFDTDPPGDAKPELPPDDAAMVSAAFPTQLPCGETALATLTVENTGTTTWSKDAGLRLGTVDDSDPLYTQNTRVDLPDGVEVKPGETWTFEIPLTGPPTEGDWHTDWRMVRESVHWFGQTWETTVSTTCQIITPPPAKGVVTLTDHSLHDDGGSFNALGASLFWAAWAYKYDKPKLEANLAWLSQHGFEYIRALGVVGDPSGPDYWDGREIQWTWPDYAAVIAGVTDLAWDKYGLRVQWTLIGDGQVSIPSEADRYALIDTFVAMSQGREGKILLFEIANEAWQNGFSGDSGLAQLRALTDSMAQKTSILVAASAPAGPECADAEAVYSGTQADIATIHFDRDVGKADGHWRPIRQPWEHQFCGLPVGSNNEPIGPGASVNSEDDPLKLVMAAVVTHVAQLPMYVFHSSAGVRGDTDIWTMAGADAFTKLDAIIPGDLASWSPQNCHWDGSPWICFAGDADGNLLADTMWPDLYGPSSGAVRVYSATKGDQFLSAPIGILNHIHLEARASLTVDVIHPITGETLATHTLAAGESFDLGGGEAFVLRGSFL